MAHRITIDGVETLEDLIGPGLDVLFVGYNPNPLAVEAGHYYARKANRFWEDLHEAGFVPAVFRGPGEDRRILEFGVGLTDVIKRPTPTIDGLTAADFRAGFDRLAFVQVGPDQRGFLDFWQHELRPALDELAVGSPA